MSQHEDTCPFCGKPDLACACPASCIHADGGGLCDACAAQRDEDPGAWNEYGHHPAGEDRWRKLLVELEAIRVAAAPGHDIPF